jgi:hypothetical protein
MGATIVTVKNLHIISINQETGEMEISGQVPGSTGAVLTIRKIKSGSLKELEHETVAQVVEGEAPAEDVKSDGQSVQAGQEVKEEVKPEVPAAEAPKV